LNWNTVINIRGVHCGNSMHVYSIYLFIILFISFIHLFICAYNVWAISPPSLLPSSSHLQAEPILPFSPILLKDRHKQ
jgi:hypothetical protein